MWRAFLTVRPVVGRISLIGPLTIGRPAYKVKYHGEVILR
jgi:hypothetical protein